LVASSSDFELGCSFFLLLLLRFKLTYHLLMLINAMLHDNMLKMTANMIQHDTTRISSMNKDNKKDLLALKCFIALLQRRDCDEKHCGLDSMTVCILRLRRKMKMIMMIRTTLVMMISPATILFDMCSRNMPDNHRVPNSIIPQLREKL